MAMPYDNRKPLATVAVERTTKRRKPMDRLSYDVQEAERLGYGCHYGRYKADHPHTSYEPQKTPAAAAPAKYEYTCQWCGGKFYKSRKSTQRYCSADCNINATNARDKKYRPKPGKEKTCATCGRMFISVRGAKYCSEICNEAGQRANQIRRRERLKKGGSIK